MPFGSCVATLPEFEDIVVETGRILEEEVFAGQMMFTKHNAPTARGICDVGAWADKTIVDQCEKTRNYFLELFLGKRDVQPFVGILWSVCVVPCYIGMTEFEGFGLVCVVLMDFVVVRPVGNIVSGLKSFLKWHKRTFDPLEEPGDLFLLCLGLDNKSTEAPRASAWDEGECWICLEPFKPVEVHVSWNADFFCCGHLLCTKCTPVATSLKECGVCRSVRPPPDDLEKRVMCRVKNKL
jgi:hypothetical protein